MDATTTPSQADGERFSDDLLAAGRNIWTAQFEHPFVEELAAGTLDAAAFRTWLHQDYRYLLDYARTFAIAGTRAREEERMTWLLGLAHGTLADELDLHRSLAADYGIDRAALADGRKAPTCVAYTNFLLRTAREGSLAETAAAVFPCAQGYLDVADHMADLADGEHRYTPFIETYTSDDFRTVVEEIREWVDDCAARFPGEHDAMREAFLTSARLEHAFWSMAYETERWEVTA